MACSFFFIHFRVFGLQTKPFFTSNTDINLAQGNNYYRLKQMDFDGAFEYSKMVVVNNTSMQATELNVYPNPATTRITVSLSDISGFETIKIYNLAGSLVKQLNLKNQTALQSTVSIAELPAGYYLVQVSSAQTTLTKKIVKQ